MFLPEVVPPSEMFVSPIWVVRFFPGAVIGALFSFRTGEFLEIAGHGRSRIGFYLPAKPETMDWELSVVQALYWFVLEIFSVLEAPL